MFNEALFIIVRTWKQPRCPLTDDWIKKCGTYMQWNIIRPWKGMHESVLMRWINLEPIIQWSKSEREKQMSHINTYIWNLERRYWWAYLQSSNADANIENKQICGHSGGRGKRDELKEQLWNIYITICKIDSGNLLYDAGSPNLMLCDNLEGWKGVGGGKEV